MKFMTYTGLNEYIKKARKEHLSEADMKRDLRSAGWLDRDIDAALQANPLIEPPTPPEGYLGIPKSGLSAISSGIARA